MPKVDLPRFVIYQPNQKEFHICMEMGDKFLRWCSYYPPSADVRFSRGVTRIEDMPAKKLPRKNIFDQGTYVVTKGDTRRSAGEKLAEGVSRKSFSFILEGEKLKGRFLLKQTPNGTIIQKYKDKYAVEEDVLSGDLSRTISTMIPGYDEAKVTLGRTQVPKAKATRKAYEEPPAEEITADKKIGDTDLHFAFYTSEGEPDICLVTGTGGEVIVLRKERKQWVLVTAAGPSILKKKNELTAYVKALGAEIGKRG